MSDRPPNVRLRRETHEAILAFIEREPMPYQEALQELVKRGAAASAQAAPIAQSAPESAPERDETPSGNHSDEYLDLDTMTVVRRKAPSVPAPESAPESVQTPLEVVSEAKVVTTQAADTTPASSTPSVKPAKRPTLKGNWTPDERERMKHFVVLPDREDMASTMPGLNEDEEAALNAFTIAPPSPVKPELLPGHGEHDGTAWRSSVEEDQERAVGEGPDPFNWMRDAYK